MCLFNKVDKVLGGKIVEECVDVCMKERLFFCRLFDYDKIGRVCYFSRVFFDDVFLILGKGFDYY